MSVLKKTNWFVISVLNQGRFHPDNGPGNGRRPKACRYIWQAHGMLKQYLEKYLQKYLKKYLISMGSVCATWPSRGFLRSSPPTQFYRLHFAFFIPPCERIHLQTDNSRMIIIVSLYLHLAQDHIDLWRSDHVRFWWGCCTKLTPNLHQICTIFAPTSK